MWAATARAARSVEPPAVYPTMIRIGRVGYLSAASPRAPSPSHTASASAAVSRCMRCSVPASAREWIGAELEPDDPGPVLLAALEVEHRPRRVRRPQALALPAAVRVVDAPVHPLGEVADGIGHAQHDELPVDERQQRVVQVAGGDRHVPP